MKHLLLSHRSKAVVLVSALCLASFAHAAQVTSITTIATGTEVSATGPDSLTVTKDSLWVSYTNGAKSDGSGGSSTVVQYGLDGTIRSKYEIAGSVDGLKVEPKTGLIWALQNQDGNSELTIIDPATGVRAHESYAAKSSTSGYDDVVFSDGRVFLSYTNPAGPKDPTIQLVKRGSDPLAVTPILLQGATGTNLANGQLNQPTTQNDPDSLKMTPWGDLMLSSGDDGQLIFVRNPGTSNSQVAFLSLLDPSGKSVSGLDDAVFVTSERGTFYLADTNNNRVLVIKAEDLSPGSLFASVGSLNELGSVNLRTGIVTPFVPNLKGPHGIVFVPAEQEEDN